MEQIERIAFLCHPYHRGGVTRWMADAAVAAARRGAQVWFVTIEPSKPFKSAGGREPMVELQAKKQGLSLNLAPATTGLPVMCAW